jgi:transcriptional regulator with GAF, ATPase, and Fis domain
MVLKMFDTNGYAVTANPDTSTMGSLAITERHVRNELQSENGMHEIIGSSPVMKALLNQIGVVAPTDSPFFLA